MNKELRKRAREANLLLLDYILKQIDSLEEETKIKRTILAACPMKIGPKMQLKSLNVVIKWEPKELGS